MDDKMAQLWVRAAIKSTKRLHTLHRRFYITTMDEDYRTKVIVELLLDVMDSYCKTQIKSSVWISTLNPNTYQANYWDRVLNVICSQIMVTRKDNWPAHWFNSAKDKRV